MSNTMCLPSKWQLGPKEFPRELIMANRKKVCLNKSGDRWSFSQRTRDIWKGTTWPMACFCIWQTNCVFQNSSKPLWPERRTEKKMDVCIRSDSTHSYYWCYRLFPLSSRGIFSPTPHPLVVNVLNPHILLKLGFFYILIPVPNKTQGEWIRNIYEDDGAKCLMFDVTKQ